MQCLTCWEGVILSLCGLRHERDYLVPWFTLLVFAQASSRVCDPCSSPRLARVIVDDDISMDRDTTLSHA